MFLYVLIPLAVSQAYFTFEYAYFTFEYVDVSHPI